MNTTTILKLFSPSFKLGNKPVFYILTLFFTLSLHAQENLVPNGGFDEYTQCPTGADLNTALGWFSPNQATPDLFNSCASISSNYGTPINGLGYQYPQDGNGYAGLVVYSYSNTQASYREYCEIKLKHTLENDHVYQISFYINLANNSSLATNNLGYAFQSDSMYFNNSQQLNLIPNYSYVGNAVCSDTLNWVKVESIYFANGNENYLILGNFENDSNTDTLSTGMPLSDVYYYLDNISIFEVLNEVSNVFTPNNDGINDKIFCYPMLSALSVDILNRWGEVIISTNMQIGWGGTDQKGNLCSEGVYFYKIYLSDSKKIEKTGFIQLIR